ncbi:hypothetical protein [Clostridium sp. UBA4548]|uniref:hypothetical protein n=1 Tax=Clostridium sp. UBA4548 TaxID=1946361 RepID=UPI0025BD958B|nr:hypothetical protein [Clostridium sp. UBA4548]
MGSSIISKFFDFLFSKNRKLEEENKENSTEKIAKKLNYLSDEIEEEDKLVVAIAASIMAGKDKPNSHFHISKITKVTPNYLGTSFQKGNYEIAEEDKLVVALAASVMAGKDKPNSRFHISRIARVDNNYLEPEFQSGNYVIAEEEKLVVALAASIMAGKHKPNSHFHISKITRVI